MVGLLYALPNTQLTRRLAREGRLFPSDYTDANRRRKRIRATNARAGSISTRRDRGAKSLPIIGRCSRASIRAETPIIIGCGRSCACSTGPSWTGAPGRISSGRAYWVSRCAMSILLCRLVWRIASRQPAAFWPFCKTFYECARKNPRAIDYVGMLAAIYLHLGPFSRFVVAVVDRQIAEIDFGRWQSASCRGNRSGAGTSGRSRQCIPSYREAI